jgi:hypothetical protein
MLRRSYANIAVQIVSGYMIVTQILLCCIATIQLRCNPWRDP